MEFGKLNNVDKVDWSLPLESLKSLHFLQRDPSPHLTIDTGAPAWSHKEWVGKIYPKGAKASEYLHHYSRYFSCIELNTTHYQIPDAERVQKWKSSVDPEFLFCPKIYKEISHTTHGLLDRQTIRDWLQFISALEGNLGPCFLQLPPHFSYDYKSELFHFLKNWPQEFKLAVEFRHPSWFEHHQIIPALVDYLQSQGIGLVILDVAGRRDLVHTSITSDFCLVRFIGNALHPSDSVRAQAWSERFALWHQAGLKNLFLFVHEPDDILVPEMHRIFLAELEKHHLFVRYHNKAPFESTDCQVPFTF